MSEWSDALEAIEADPELTPEQYEEWLDAGNGKFYKFFRAYGINIGRAQMQEEIIKLLEEQRDSTYKNYQKDIDSKYWANRLGLLGELIALIKGEK